MTEILADCIDVAEDVFKVLIIREGETPDQTKTVEICINLYDSLMLVHQDRSGVDCCWVVDSQPVEHSAYHAVSKDDFIGWVCVIHEYIRDSALMKIIEQNHLESKSEKRLDSCKISTQQTVTLLVNKAADRFTFKHTAATNGSLRVCTFELPHGASIELMYAELLCRDVSKDSPVDGLKCFDIRYQVLHPGGGEDYASRSRLFFPENELLPDAVLEKIALTEFWKRQLKK